MEAIQWPDTMMNQLVDEIAQYEPRLFRELHYDRQAVKKVLAAVLHVVATHGIPAEPEAHLPLRDESRYDSPNEALMTPDPCIWMP